MTSDNPRYRGLKPFQKGQVGNPTGRPALPEELKKIREFTGPELNRYLAKYARMEVWCVEEAAKSQSLPAIEALIASAFVKAIEKGEPDRLQIFLDRAIPKPRESAPVINVGVTQLSNEELIIKAKEAIEYLSKDENLALEGQVVADEV